MEMYKISKTHKLNSFTTLQHNYNLHSMHIQKKQAEDFERYSEIYSYGMSFCNQNHQLEILSIIHSLLLPVFMLMKRAVKIPVPADL